MFVQKHSSRYVHIVAGLIFLAVPEGLVQRHLLFPRCSICVQLRTFPGLVHPALATLISLFFPTTCPASPEAHASLSAHTTAFAGAPACVARAVPTHCQESRCRLFLPVPTALLEELGTVYHIPSVGLILAMSAILSWPCLFRGPSSPGLATGHNTSLTLHREPPAPVCLFIIIFGAKGDRYVYLSPFSELGVTTMSFIIISGTKRDWYVYLLSFSE